MLPQSDVLDLINKLKNTHEYQDRPVNFNDFVEQEKRGKLNVIKNYENGWAVVKQFYDSKNSKMMGNRVVSLHKSLDEVPYDELQHENTVYPITKDLIHDYSITGWSRFANMPINEEVDIFGNMRNKIMDFMIQQTLSKTKKKPTEQEFMQLKTQIKQQLAGMHSDQLVAQYNKITGNT